MLQQDAGWVAVLDGNTFLGVLTPVTLHEALRRSVDADALSVHPDDVDVESVSAV
jgi:osmoprotectant transport system ATP-binding protein